MSAEEQEVGSQLLRESVVERQDSTQEDSLFFEKINNNNKQEYVLRIGFTNINGLPEFNQHSKNDELREAINRYQIDIMGMSEINRNWNGISKRNRWKARTRGWWENSHTSMAYNTKDCVNNQYQPGGNIISSIDRSASRVIGSGCDERGLGRWCWTRYRGRHDVTLRVICAYRPCKPSTGGSNTTYSQQQRYFDQNELDLEPRQAFLDDLKILIQACHEEGDQIILMMDCNEEVTSPNLRRWLRQVRLSETVSSFHNREKGPATYHRGSKQIDGIFSSHTIQPLQCGFLPFGEFPSDHRALWCDISYDNAFGYKMQKIVVPSARRLKCDDPRVRNKWIELMKGEVRKRKLDERIFRVEASMMLPLPKHLADEYDAILKQRRQAIEYADRHCRKLTMGHVPYSPEVSIAGAKIELWKGVITKKKHAKYSQGKLRRLEKKIGIRNSLHATLEEAETNLKAAINEYKRLKKNAKQLRKTFLETKAEAIAKEQNGKEENIYKQLIQREKQRESARTIKYVLQKIKQGGVTKVDVVNDEGETIELTTKEDIERACMSENRAKYNQTNNTPCMRGSLFRDLGLDANTTAGRRILDGNYTVPNDAPQYAQEFFDQLQRPPMINENQEWNTTISTKDFQTGWKRIKERTSAGISGIHFGHMKASARDKMLSNFEASIAQIPYATGYSPPSWQYGVSVMIHKKAGVDLVTKLRTITLLEADFNYNNKILGRSTLQHAEKHGLIAKEQYGSRPGKSAIDHAVHKRLTYDILRQGRIPGALCSNDAKSCFDRIIHAIVCLAYERLGIAQPPVHCMIKSIQNMKHHIRTTFGDSRFTMSSDGCIIPFQGVLQGNGASPASWVVISTPLLKMIRKADGGAHLMGAISKETAHIVGYAFVDDTDLIQADMRSETITVEETMQKMQVTIDMWEAGLKLTGGAIVPEKSWVYPVAFEFDHQGKWSYKNHDIIQHNFTVKDANDEVKDLQMLSPSTGKCTLGVILAPDGNNEDAIEELRMKAETWKDMITVGHIDKMDAWNALDTTIMKSIQYPAPALTLTEKEWAYIMAPILEGGLPKASISRNFPRTVLYGPKEEGGLNNSNPYVIQGSTQIALLYDHLDSNTMTGELFRCSIEMAKVEIGIGTHFLLSDYSIYNKLCTDSIIKNIWKFSWENKITIEDNVTPTLRLQREHDVYLMEAFVSQGFTFTELGHLNRCRLYLQATTLSDLVDGFGNRVTNEALNCQRDEEVPHWYKFPNQERPHQPILRLWKRALKQSFTREDDQRKLRQPLGQWRYNDDKWLWYYNPISQNLYKKRNGRSWQTFRRLTRGGRIGQTPTFTYVAEAFQLPLTSSRATVKKIAVGQYQLTGWTVNAVGNEPEHMEVETLQERIELNNINLPLVLINDDNENRAHLIESITQGTAQVVSDGSYNLTRKIGTAGFIIENEYSDSMISGQLDVPGIPSVQCSHRSELMGILGVLYFINGLCNESRLTQGCIELGCDGEGAVTTMQEILQWNVKSSSKHFDILRSIQHLMRNSPITWKFRHVKGHQDDLLTYEELDRWAQLNVEADALAKDRMTEALLRVDPLPQALPYDTCKISICDNSNQSSNISSNLMKTIVHNIGKNKIRQYWAVKKQIGERELQVIDWNSLARARKGLKTSRSRWLSKWSTGMCGVGIMLKKYKWQQHTKCPRCQQDDEDVQHVLQCPAVLATATWNHEIQKLQEWMIQQQGEPDMVDAIIQNIKAWRSHSPYPTRRYDQATLRECILYQDRIGWRLFLEGFIYNGWLHHQQEYLTTIRSQKSASLWMAKLLRKIWEIQWTMWEHRNNTLHNEGPTIHRHEMQAIDNEIIAEFAEGLGNLPRQRYHYLFRGTVQQRLNDNLMLKQMWLGSVWSARDMYMRVEARERCHIATAFFGRWQERLFPRRQEQE